MRFFATAAKGTEGALRDELRELRTRGVRADRGGVHFEGGDLEDGLRVCLWSRVAQRVLVELTRFPADDAGSLYDGVRAVDWPAWIAPRNTLAVRAAGTTPRLVHTGFGAQKAKDAIADAMRERAGARPSVDRDDPDVDVFVHLAKGEALVYLDLAGEPLHLRGYRAQGGAAPLRETLAAAVVRLSGWDRRSPLLDPMCGSGTLAIEADLWSRGIAPGLTRSRFGVERWAWWSDDIRARARQLLEERGARADDATRAPRDAYPEVVGADVDPRALDIARSNAAKAHARVTLRAEDVRATRGTSPPGFVVTNPPYGERIAAGPGFHDEMSAALRGLRSHTVALLAGSKAIPDAMRTTPSRWLALWNGPLECRLLIYGPPSHARA